MCGICGIIAGHGAFVPTAVRRMTKAMIHRGPDDEGLDFIELGSSRAGPTIGLGFRRLSIIDISSAGHQPMANPTSGDWLVFNGEVYNFQKLRAELQCEGVRFRGTSDTEVLLHALSKWGDLALQRITGMYSLAFYHSQSRRVLLARDPLGIKPLYYSEVAGGTVFASEIRAILASKIVPHDLDHAGIATMLAYGAPQDPLTIHRAIRSFPAGHYSWLYVEPCGRVSRVLPRPFWRFPAETLEPVTPSRAASDVRELLKSAVRQHLVSDRPIGVFLSAGLDSYAIAALAKAASGNVATFTVGFDGLATNDESNAAAREAEKLGTHHSTIQIRSSDVGYLWEQWLLSADRPSIDGFNTYVVSRSVRQAGVAVALSGLGGDELFGGYPNFVYAKQYHFWLRFSRLLPNALRARGIQLLTHGRSDTFREKAMEMMDGEPGLESVALRLRRILTDSQIRRLGFDIAKMPLDRNVMPVSSFDDFSAFDAASAFTRIARLECRFYMGNTLLRDTDASSMANSIEVRVPLLDQSVVDYVMKLPEPLKMRHGQANKLLLRSALTGIIPQVLLDRPKTGFCLPVDRWMHGTLRDYCESCIDYVANAGVLDSCAVRQIWNEFIASPASVHWVRPMTLVSLGSYLRNAQSRVTQ
jgi:asparagine synthase (glutamine-hydrolysing)